MSPANVLPASQSLALYVLILSPLSPTPRTSLVSTTSNAFHHEHCSANTYSTVDYVPLAYWSMIEVEVALICACMPSLRSLYVGLTRSKTLSDPKSYHSGGYYGSGGHSSNNNKGPNISVTEKGGVPAYSPAMRKPGFVNPTNGGFIELHDMDKDNAGPATPHSISAMRNHVRSPVMKSRAEISTSEVGVERRGEGILQTRRVEITSEPVNAAERNVRY